MLVTRDYYSKERSIEADARIILSLCQHLWFLPGGEKKRGFLVGITPELERNL